MQIHIFGASGSGVTTIGKALSKELDLSYFDTDDYYWKRPIRLLLRIQGAPVTI
ncbi:MAG: shikimate kinase [Bacteroidota bacterium]